MCESISLFSYNVLSFCKEVIYFENVDIFPELVLDEAEDSFSLGNFKKKRNTAFSSLERYHLSV